MISVTALIRYQVAVIQTEVMSKIFAGGSGAAIAIFMLCPSIIDNALVCGRFDSPNEVYSIFKPGEGYSSSSVHFIEPRVDRGKEREGR